MDQATWDLVVQWAPWVIVVVLLVALYDFWKDRRQGRAQQMSHEFAKMGSKLIVKFLDAYARDDRPAELAAFNEITAKYGVEGGALIFAYDVFNMSIDDLLASDQYRDQVGKRIAEELLGMLIDDDIEAQLVPAATSAQKFGLKSLGELLHGLSRKKIEPVKSAFRSVVERFRDPDKIDDELMVIAVTAVPELMKDPAHAAKLRELVGSGTQ